MTDDEVAATALYIGHLAAAIKRVRAIHVNDRSGQVSPTDPGMCEVCMWEWPCPTIRALDDAR